MAVARIHGKVKCRPFKEKRRRAPFTKHGITGDGLFVSCFLSFAEFRISISPRFRSSEECEAETWSVKALCSHSFHLEIGCNGRQYSKA